MKISIAYCLLPSYNRQEAEGLSSASKENPSRPSLLRYCLLPTLNRLVNKSKQIAIYMLIYTFFVNIIINLCSNRTSTQTTIDR
jgi:rRNA pseudouridine-1189 N-methylase Emg1 (Nep1/Mra1 family)